MASSTSNKDENEINSSVEEIDYKERIKTLEIFQVILLYVCFYYFYHWYFYVYKFRKGDIVELIYLKKFAKWNGNLAIILDKIIENEHRWPVQIISNKINAKIKPNNLKLYHNNKQIQKVIKNDNITWKNIINRIGNDLWKDLASTITSILNKENILNDNENDNISQKNIKKLCHVLINKRNLDNQTAEYIQKLINQSYVVLYIYTFWSDCCAWFYMLCSQL